MLEVNIPGRGSLGLEYLVLDINGTISRDGALIEGVSGRLDALRGQFDITAVTADTFGKARELGERLKIKLHRLETGKEAEQKAGFVRRLGAGVTAAMGNGANDALMLRESALGICVLGQEGTAADAAGAADLLAPDINAALDLLIRPTRLIATLRR